ncbi:MAG: hypothetical protein IPJ94_09490 [Chloroflexi bacterium]|nr:hypothetical protein [Chloroflexota bacterium]
MARQVGSASTAVYQAIIAYKVANDGASPTVRELARLTGAANQSSVVYHLCRLEEAGLIEREFALARVIRVVGGEWRPPREVAGTATCRLRIN